MLLDQIETHRNASSVHIFTQTRQHARRSSQSLRLPSRALVVDVRTAVHAMNPEREERHRSDAVQMPAGSAS